MKKIEIECNRKVRDFVCSQVKLLTGLNVGQAYELLKKDGRNIFKHSLIRWSVHPSLFTLSMKLINNYVDVNLLFNVRVFI